MELLDRIDAYCDAVPRSAARAEEHGPLVLFVPIGPAWPYYARPRRGAEPPTSADVVRVRERQRELGLPEELEWIDDVSPAVAAAATEGGLAVGMHPLMVLEGQVPWAAPVGVELRLVSPEDDVGTFSSVAAVAFGSPGTAPGEAGVEELEAHTAERNPARDELHRERIANGVSLQAVALLDGFPVATGIHQPVDGVTEIVGVGTLPAFRRRGLGAAVTALLVDDARGRGVETIILTAADDDVARMYGSIGFRRVGTSCMAAPPRGAEG